MDRIANFFPAVKVNKKYFKTFGPVNSIFSREDYLQITLSVRPL